MRILKELVKANIKISAISCSNGATICHDKTNSRVIYLCYEYKCKRMYVSNEGLKKIKCCGGKLDYQANSDVLDPESGDPLLIVGLTETGTLFIWRENDAVFRQVSWTSSQKILNIVDFDINATGLIVCTKQGLCYIADFKKTRIAKRLKLNSTKGDGDCLAKSEFDALFEFTELQQLPLANRCFSVTSDMYGRNYSALQYAPNTNMTFYPRQEPSTLKSEIQSLLSGNNFVGRNPSDICLVYKNKKLHAHKFILASRCGKFFNKKDLDGKSELVLDDHLNKATVSTFQMLLSYVYSNKCDSGTLTDALRTSNCNSQGQLTKFLQSFKELCEKFDLKQIGRVYDGLISNAKTFKNEKNHFIDTIEHANKTISCMPLRFTRNSFESFYDCEIECNDGKIIACHKCILIARSDYFNNMLLGDWLESTLNRIRLPFDSDLLSIVVDYLYTDDIVYGLAYAEKPDKEIEILFNLFVLSDQMLLERLKNLCEFRLANLINLKNAIEIYQFTVSFGALQLKDFCTEFVCNNLVSLIEAKSFDSIDADMLKELKRFYLMFYDNNVGSRRITPYSDGLSPSDVDLVEPIELLYNPKFLDGSIVNDDDMQKKKIHNLSATWEPVQVPPSPSDSDRIHEPVVTETLKKYDCVEEKKKEAQLEKWEKVKKKVRYFKKFDFRVWVVGPEKVGVWLEKLRPQNCWF
jgi:hypothetical protein